MIRSRVIKVSIREDEYGLMLRQLKGKSASHWVRNLIKQRVGIEIKREERDELQETERTTM